MQASDADFNSVRIALTILAIAEGCNTIVCWCPIIVCAASASSSFIVHKCKNTQRGDNHYDY